MRSVFVFILLLSTTKNLFGQNIDRVKKYLSLVDYAETDFCNNQFLKSDSIYAIAFGQGVYIHTIDLYNACHSALLCKDFSKASVYMDSLVLRGFSLNHFMRKYAFQEFRATNFWTEFITRYPDLKRQYRQRINWDLRNLVETMYVNDQYLALDNYEENRPKREKVFYENTTTIKQQILAHGFPGDSEVGVFFNENDTLYEPFSPIELMIYQAYQKFDFRLTPILKGYIENGGSET